MTIDENVVNKAAMDAIAEVATSLWEDTRDREDAALNLAYISGVCDMARTIKEKLLEK